MAPPCGADANGDALLNVLDFVQSQLDWVAPQPAADCNLDSTHSILDFVCFQLEFIEGCD